MKIKIPTKKYNIIEELSKPFPYNPLVNTRTVKEGTNEAVVVSYAGQLVGEVCCWNLDRTQETVWYCRSCGCEPYAVWPSPFYHLGCSGNTNEWYSYTMKNAVALKPYYEKESKLDEYEKAIANEKREIKTCPVCGGELSFGKNEKAEVYESYQKLEAYVKSCDLPIITKTNVDEVENIKTNIEKLKDYFLRIINIETNIRSLKQRLFVLYSLSHEINRQAKFAQLYPVMSQKKEITEKIDGLQAEFRAKANELSELQRRKDILCAESVAVPHVAMPVQPIEPIKPIYATANIFNKKKVTAENEAKSEKYNAEVTLYNKALAEYPVLLEAAKKQQEELREKAVQERNRDILELGKKIEEKTIALEKFKNEVEMQQVTLENKLSLLQNNTDYPAVQLKVNIDTEIETAEKTLASLFKQKNQLYATNIIFGKYHDLAAITSFYEYLLSGRCVTLDGVNGCYNLYESELRANIIINKLDAIGDALEQIKGNQYMLYSQLQQINTELSVLNSTTTAMLNGIKDTAEVFLEHSAVIAHNSAVSAYYAKLNAEIASSDRYISMICW
ncbi:MAG: hypothetical protein IJW89_00230 [Clostridia bacterium]|nr:hypothetical protein [Clostridia bacterium]